MAQRLISIDTPPDAGGVETYRSSAVTRTTVGEESEARDSATLALTQVPDERTVQSAALVEAALLRDQLAREQVAHRLQRANAEQSRRVADCLPACHLTLLKHLQQPCFQLNREGHITLWNPAMAEWTGISPEAIEGQPLSACCPLPTCKLVEEAIRLALAAETQAQSAPVLTLQGPLCLSSGRTAEEISLLPQYRIPHVIEAFVVLVCR